MRRATIALLVLAFSSGCRGCTGGDEGGERPSPLYPTEGVKPQPLAERFCRAVQGLPAERRAACCNMKPGIHFGAPCTSALSQALADGAIALAEAEVAACEAAMTKQLEVCDWVGPLVPPVPKACSRVVRGRRAAGEACRSALECTVGLRCAGSGAAVAGRCAPPAVDRNACNFAVDVLATYARQEDLEEDHPQCAGYCERDRCAAPIAPGGQCEMNAQCGRGNRCSAGTCVAGSTAAEGEPCLGGDCAEGLTCWQHTCIVPKALGEACSSPFECKADCVAGKCANGCGQLPAILRPKTATAAPAAPGSPG